MTTHTTPAASIAPSSPRRGLVWLNVLGGLAVLGSYVAAFALSPEIRAGLWGGVPEALRPLYTVNMLAAATGYFPLTWALVFRPGPLALRERFGLPRGWIAACFALVLIPSALWLPLTALHQTAPSPALWALIRLVLLAVGLGATGFVWLTFRLARGQGGATWLAFAGSVPFWLQTAVLDALIWPAFHPAG